MWIALAFWVVGTVGLCPLGLASPLSAFIPGGDHIVSSPNSWTCIVGRVIGFAEVLESNA